MNWVSLILGLVKLANTIFSWLHENKMIQEGEDRAVARALAEMAKRSTTIRQIEGRFANMTPEQVNRELQGDFRD